MAKSCNMADTNFKRLPNSSHFNVISCLCYIIMLHVLTWTQKKKKGKQNTVLKCWAVAVGCSLVRMSKVSGFGTGELSPQQPDFF